MGRRKKGVPPPPPKPKNPWGVRFHNGLSGEEVIQTLTEILEKFNTGDRVVMPEVAFNIGVTKRTLDNWRDGKFERSKGDPIMKFSEEQQQEITWLIDRIYTLGEIYNTDLLTDKETVRGAMFLLERSFGYVEKKEHNIKGDGSVNVVLGEADKYAK